MSEDNDNVEPEQPAGSKKELKHQDTTGAEENDDVVGPLPPALKQRIKAMSDLTGMDVPTLVGHARPNEHRRRADRKTVSDLTVMLNLGPEVLKEHSERRRQLSSSDVVTKFGYVPNLGNQDLRLAEEVSAYGIASERLKAGISDEESSVIIEAEEIPVEFTYNYEGLTSEDAEKLLAKYGRNELPEKYTPKWLLFLSQFWAPMPIMIWLAIIIEAGIQNFLDMGILLLIQFTNASISFYETNKAGNAVAALKSSLKPTATVKRDGKLIVMDSALLVPGDTVLLGSGSAIPADCRLNDSEIDVDQAALTGESLPVTFYKGDSVKLGSTVVRGEGTCKSCLSSISGRCKIHVTHLCCAFYVFPAVEATVEFTGAETFFGKTASLLEDTHELVSRSQRWFGPPFFAAEAH